MNELCEQCGGPRPPGLTFCTSCGHRFGDPSDAPTLAQPAVPPPPPTMPTTPYVAPPPPPPGGDKTRLIAIATGGAVALVLLVLILVGLGGGGDDDDSGGQASQDEITTTTRLTTTTRPTTTTTTSTTTTTTVPPTTAPPPPTTAPPPTSPPATGVPSGLLCRDLYSRGFTYAQAVDYWYAEGRPSRMDADSDGIPCETVYPASEVEAYWGYTDPGDPGDTADEAQTVIMIVQNELYGCGYAPALETSADGPYADGLYLVHAYADVGYDVLEVSFEVSPYSGEVIPTDQVSFEVLNCQA